MADQDRHNDLPPPSAAQLEAALAPLSGLAIDDRVAAELLWAQGGHGDAGAERIEALVRCEPALATDVLAEAARRGLEADVPRALRRLGAGGLRALVLSAGVAEATARGFDRGRLIRHCVAAACAAQLIADELGLDAQRAYWAGLLHDVGKLAMTRIVPKSFARAVAQASRGEALWACERRLLGADHAAVGRRLAELWQLPEEFGQAIWLHHHPPEALPPVTHRRMVLVVALANALAHAASLGDCDQPAPPVQGYAAAAGLAEGKWRQVVASLESAVEERFRAAAPSANVSYPDALAGAAGELAALNERLTRQTAALQTQAAALRHVIAISDSLRPQTTVAQALVRIADVTADVLGVSGDRPPVAAYSVGQDRRELLAVTIDAHGAPSWRVWPAQAPLADQPPAPSPARDAWARLLGPGRQWQAFGDLVRHEHRPLVCQGRWVGGVFAPGSGEAQLGEALHAVDSAAGAFLAIVQGRAAAVTISEQLAGAAQTLAAAQQAIADARTHEAIVEFAAGAAHELNNPLAVISGRAQLMARQASAPDQQQAWAQMVEQAQRMSDLLTALMEYARPASPRPEPLDAGELARGALADFSSGVPQAAAETVDIEVAEPAPRVLADSAQMRRVLVELLDNAVRASQGARVRLRAVVTAEGVQLSVVDSGSGMDETARQAAFTPFYSAQRAGRRRGLGLTMARRLVELNGGRIWIDSRQGQGTVANVLLPAAT